MNAILRAAQRLTTPLLPDDYLTLVDPLWSSTRIRARVVSLSRETPDTVTAHLRPSRHLPRRAGQYVRLGVDLDGVRHWRSYSISSAPDAAVVSITVKRIDGGLVSTYLTQRLRPGDVVHLEAPQGDFVLPVDDRAAQVLLVGAGSGLTPIISMLRDQRQHQTIGHATLVAIARSKQNLLFREELQMLARECAWLDVRVFLTAETGRPDIAALARAGSPERAPQAWVCGPADVLESAEHAWSEAGLRNRLTMERFHTPAFAEPGTGGTVTFTTTRRTVQLDGTTSILAAAENAGILMPHGCRMGICHNCVLPKNSGRVQDLRDGRISGDTDDLVQTCVSTPVGDVEIDL